MTKLMKIKSLKNYGIPSYILNIWEKHYSPYLLPIQEEAVRNYGILEEENQNLLVIAPTSSGKTFIGEMAALTQVIHQKKIIYLVPFRCLAEEKYLHFKNLYSSYGLEIVVSTRDHREDDDYIIQGNYKIAVMVYEKFNYFLLKHPNFLLDVSLVVIDEMQLINNPKWGPLLENIIDQLQKRTVNLRIIALSAFIENQEALLKWFPAHSLISYQRPVELRKGIVREGIFKYITSKRKKAYQREIFFKPEAVLDKCYEDYLLETVRYFVNRNEPTLIFFATCAETRYWARWLASQLDSPAASSAIGELSEMEETLSKDELLELLQKGVVYHNQDLSWEEKNLIEIYLKKGEIKIICATNILAIGISLPFKNVIISLDKIHNGEEDIRYIYRTNLTFSDIENMGGRAGILNIEKDGNSAQSGPEFGRVIFLAPSLLSEAIYQNLYFKYLQNNSALQVTNHLVKKEKDLLTFLLRLIVNHKEEYSSNKIKQYLKKISPVSPRKQSKLGEENNFSGYWKFDFDKNNIEEEIDYCLNRLVKNKLIREDEKGVLSPTANGILSIAKGIKVETYCYFKAWIEGSKMREISDLELLIVLSLSKNGKDLPIPFSQSYRNDYRRGKDNYNYEGEQEETYGNKILRLILDQDEGDKEIYRNKFILKEGEEETSTLEDYLIFKKTLLLYDWIRGNKDIRSLEQEYIIYKGAILRLAEGFCWLTDSLAALAESSGWKKKRKEDYKKITLLSKRLIEGIEEEGLGLARLYIPGLSRDYIRRLVQAGYNDEKCLRDASGEELGKLLPQRLVNRIQKNFKEIINIENQKLKILNSKKLGIEDCKIKTCYPKHETRNFQLATCNSKPEIIKCNPKNDNPNSDSKTKNEQLKTVLEIDKHRPDRIIFMDKKIKVTATEFSLICLLAQNPEQVLSYDKLLDELWKDEEDAIYNRVSYHISKIRRNIIKIINENKIKKAKVKKIFMVVPKRGVMLNLKAGEIQTK